MQYCGSVGFVFGVLAWRAKSLLLGQKLINANGRVLL
jgi:hypothetical protein